MSVAHYMDTMDYAPALEGHAEAMKMGGQPKTLEEEIAELRMSDKVEEELAALKAAQQGGAGTPAQKEDDAHG